MAFDIFLKIPDIEGEAVSEKHKNSIEIESWSWGETNQGAGGAGGGGVGRSFQFTKHIDKSSPLLLGAACTGKHFDKVQIHHLRTDQKTGKGQDYYKVTLSDCLISSMNGDGEDSTLPMDSFSINFAKVEVHYQTQDGQAVEGECTHT
jgi:type VI secretion system secreted protein Hcp